MVTCIVAPGATLGATLGCLYFFRFCFLLFFLDTSAHFFRELAAQQLQRAHSSGTIIVLKDAQGYSPGTKGCTPSVAPGAIMLITTKQQHVGAGNEPPMFGIDVILCKSIESDLNLEKLFSMTFAVALYQILE